MLLWLTTVDWQTGPHCNHYYCALCDTYGTKKIPEEPERGWGTWRDKVEAEDLQREATIQPLGDGSCDFNEALTLLNELMKHSECATWEAMQQDEPFQKGVEAVARRAAERRAAKRDSDMRSQKKRKQGESEGAGKGESEGAAESWGRD